jgi:hypothetical protein
MRKGLDFMKILSDFKEISIYVLLWMSLTIGIMGMANAQDKQRIAVLTLVNQAKLKPEEVDYLTNVVRQSFASKMGKGYLVMTQENILTLLPENKKIEDCLDECEVDVGRNLGASLIVTGAVLIFNKNYRLNIKVHETKEGALLASEIAKGTNLDEVEASIILSVNSLINTIKDLGQSDQQSLAELEAQKARLVEEELKKRADAQRTQEQLAMAERERIAREAKEAREKAERMAKEEKEKAERLAREARERAEKMAREESDRHQRLEREAIEKARALERAKIERAKGLAIHMGFGTSTSYSGMGIQGGVSYIGAVNGRLLLSYGGLQNKASSASPGVSLQVFFGEPSDHAFGLGISYISYEINQQPLPYEVSIKSFDAIYKIDIGDLNGFELQLGLSLESRSAKDLKEKREISDLSGLSPMFLLGLNYVFEVKK